MELHPENIPYVKQPYGAFEVKQSGWLDMPLMLDTFRKYLQAHKLCINEKFDYTQLKVSGEGVEYKGFHARLLIFCEGYLVKDNPFFKDIHIIPCKGDVLTIACNNGPTDRIIKKGCYMVQTGKEKYKVGSTYAWDVNDSTPTTEGKALLASKLEDMIDLPFEIEMHQAGIRPTTKDRKPIAMQHPEYHNLFALNGLGTKGVLQGPFWVEELMGKL